MAHMYLICKGLEKMYNWTKILTETAICILNKNVMFNMLKFLHPEFRTI